MRIYLRVNDNSTTAIVAADSFSDSKTKRNALGKAVQPILKPTPFVEAFFHKGKSCKQGEHAPGVMGLLRASLHRSNWN